MTKPSICELAFSFSTTAVGNTLSAPNELGGAYSVCTAFPPGSIDHLSLFVAYSGATLGRREARVSYQTRFVSPVPLETVLQAVATLARHRLISCDSVVADEHAGACARGLHDHLLHQDLTAEREGVFVYLPAPQSVVCSNEYDKALSTKCLNGKEARTLHVLERRYPRLAEVLAASPVSFVQAVPAVCGAIGVDIRYLDAMRGGCASGIVWIPSSQDVALPPASYPFELDRAVRRRRVRDLARLLRLVQRMRSDYLMPPTVVDFLDTPD